MGRRNGWDFFRIKKKHHYLDSGTQMNSSRISKKKSTYRFSAVKVRTSKTKRNIQSSKETV